jgi:hypothetical protein
MDVITHEANKLPGGKNLSACCIKTLEELVANNPMMACQHCEKIIKRFEEESAFQHYVKFCRSRKRKIEEASYKNYKIILFNK